MIIINSLLSPSVGGEEWFIHYLEQNSCPWQEMIL